MAKKQTYETEQITKPFHNATGKAGIDKTASEIEAIRATHVAAIATGVVPVRTSSRSSRFRDAAHHHVGGIRSRCT